MLFDEIRTFDDVPVTALHATVPKCQREPQCRTAAEEPLLQPQTDHQICILVARNGGAGETIEIPHFITTVFHLINITILLQ